MPMEYGLLNENDLEGMLSFSDDQYTRYTREQLSAFLREPNAYGFVARKGSEIIGFAYGYVLPLPDGRKHFYLHAIDVAQDCQAQGVGTELMRFIRAHAHDAGCQKLFLITSQQNAAACRCYEKAGGMCKGSDDCVYVFK